MVAGKLWRLVGWLLSGLVIALSVYTLQQAAGRVPARDPYALPHAPYASVSQGNLGGMRAAARAFGQAVLFRWREDGLR
ncbi:hypothetical protein SAMN05421543_11745 [Alicyclobacillus macrosporangiidus]|uniref:Uncharacterized protein n=1 Tax=Alicyclobacillus macrosporangiidus TaxID=392015 RepID=A0A1I7KMG2_9BACL|nr:hypothetical protein SAMN05421543_11745 [Alicyclobacillus macrosporangiidus]